MKAVLEKVLPPDQNRSFLHFEFEARRFRTPFHYHPEVELTLIVDGPGHRYVGDHIGRFDSGDLVLIGPNLPHMYTSDDKFHGPAHAVVTQFLPTFLGEDFLKVGELAPVRKLLERSRVGLAFYGRTREKVATRMLELKRLEGLARLSALLQILELLAWSVDCRPLASPGYSPSLALYQGERINNVCALISRRFREGITQSEAARAAKMSPPSFSRFFKRATNRTFRAFLNEVRVGHASHLLVESDKTVAEICYESGFGNLSNFNRQFLKLRRVAPRLYRNDRFRRENARLEYAQLPHRNDIAAWKRLFRGD